MMGGRVVAVGAAAEERRDLLVGDDISSLALDDRVLRESSSG